MTRAAVVCELFDAMLAPGSAAQNATISSLIGRPVDFCKLKTLEPEQATTAHLRQANPGASMWFVLQVQLCDW